MDYQKNFQDMIARYNRELLRTYQRQRPVPPVQPMAVEVGPEEIPVQTVSRPPEEELPSAKAVSSIPEEVPEQMKAASERPGDDASVQSDAVSSSPEEDTRPHYPLFEPTPFVPRTDRPRAFIEEEVLPESFSEQQEELISEGRIPSEETRETVPPSAVPTAEPQTASGGAPTEVGLLQVFVTTAREGLPVEGAHVTVSSTQNGETTTWFVGLTDRSGKTTMFSLPAASRQLSLTPGNGAAAYTPYNIEVAADGYYRMENIGLPMYGGVRALLPVSLIPLPEFGTSNDTLVFPDSGPTGLSERGGNKT